MPVNLVPDNLPEWASKGKLGTISPEKYAQGWTGNPSDYAFAESVNTQFNNIDKRNNQTASVINKVLQRGVADWNALYQYSTDSIVTHSGKLYRAKKPSAGSVPPSGDSSNDDWELISGQEWVTEELDLKADIDSPTFTGMPLTPTPKNQDHPTQIVNVEYVENEILKRIRGSSVIDLTSLEATKAYPILLAKDNLPTHSLITRYVGFGSESLGNMRLVVKGFGNGLNNRNNSYLEVINMNDTSDASVKYFVKKIQCRDKNSVIVVWLRGGAKYNIEQRNSEVKWQLIESSITLEGDWLVSVEEWNNAEHITDGVWNAKAHTDYLIDYTSTSETGAVETCGVIGFTASKTPPAGALICNGAEISRVTYAKLFAKIGVFYGVGDGQNTFNVPDCRGLVVRGLDLGKGVDSNQLVTKAYGGSEDRTTIDGIGSTQGDAIRNITGTFPKLNFPSSMLPATGALYGESEQSNFRGDVHGWSWANAKLDASRVVPVANENQVKNVAFLPFIYYL